MVHVHVQLKFQSFTDVNVDGTTRGGVIYDGVLQCTQISMLVNFSGNVFDLQHLQGTLTLLQRLCMTLICTHGSLSTSAILALALLKKKKDEER